MESSGFKPKLAHCNKAIISHFTAVCLCYKWHCNYTENIFYLRATFVHTVELLSLANVTMGRKENNDNCCCAGVTPSEGKACSRYRYFSLTFSVTHTFSFLSPGKICKGRVKEMFVNIMCKAESDGCCMLNRPSLCQANQLPPRR